VVFTLQSRQCSLASSHPSRPRSSTAHSDPIPVPLSRASLNERLSHPSLVLSYSLSSSSFLSLPLLCPHPAPLSPSSPPPPFSITASLIPIAISASFLFRSIGQVLGVSLSFAAQQFVLERTLLNKLGDGAGEVRPPSSSFRPSPRIGVAKDIQKAEHIAVVPAFLGVGVGRDRSSQRSSIDHPRRSRCCRTAYEIRQSMPICSRSRSVPFSLPPSPPPYPIPFHSFPLLSSFYRCFSYSSPSLPLLIQPSSSPPIPVRVHLRRRFGRGHPRLRLPHAIVPSSGPLDSSR
jgi:hypothetical protein